MNQPQLSAYEKARLLSMTVTRRSSREVSVVITPPLFVLFYSRYQDPTNLIIWAVLFIIFALVSAISRRLFARDEKVLSDEKLVSKWQTYFYLVWVLFGLFWSAGVWLTMGKAPFEFTLLFYMALSGVQALAATSLAATFRGFQLNFIACWGVGIFFVYAAFPSHWLFLYPLTAIYGFAIYQHAKGTNRFVMEQLALEQKSAHLAEQFRLARDAAENALQAKSQFLATASHDLRQPVHAMGMLIEAARRRNHDVKVAPLLNELQDCVSSITLMFNSLLDLSRIEAGVMHSRPVIVDLASVFKDVEVMFKEDATRRGLELRFHLPRHARARVHADPALLRQVIFNLTQNALRYTRQGGALLSVRKRRADWMIEVWDTGVGVAEVDREKIFLPYERRALGIHMESEGMGLGLAVVKRCAAMMAATVGVTSQVGRGSRFWVKLPQITRVNMPLINTTSTTTTSTKKAARGEFVKLTGACLVVEDDPLVIAAWAALFDEWGIDARFASALSEAIAHLESGFSPNAILCDQRLRSGESGYEVLQELLSRVPSASGAMVSGEFNSPDLLQAENDGYLVLHKPIDIDQLHALLSRWLTSDNDRRFMTA
jgi:signal transduction histidine kinase/CheY-like chemotaxis protein